MARFQAELPIEIIENFEDIHSSAEKMIGEMTRAGANKVYKNAISNMRKSFKDTKRLEKCFKITRTYKTPSDDGINTKIGMYGYIDAEKKHPAPLIANAREYGSSRGEARKPFFRKSFKENEITEEMLAVQDKYLPKE